MHIYFQVCMVYKLGMAVQFVGGGFPMYMLPLLSLVMEVLDLRGCFKKALVSEMHFVHSAYCSYTLSGRRG